MNAWLPILSGRVVAPASGPALVAHAIAGSANTNSATTAAIDTTGVNLLVVSSAWYDLTTADVTITDSKGNTWTPLNSSVVSNIKERMFYCVSPSVGSGHTFTSTGTATFPSVAVQAWSGMTVVSPIDQQNGATGTGATLANNSISTGQANTVVITTVAFSSNRSLSSINDSYTVSDSLAEVGGVYIGGAMAYKVFTGTGTTGPTWTFSGTTAASTRITSFKY